MAGEGLFASALANLGTGYLDQEAVKRKQAQEDAQAARQARLDAENAQDSMLNRSITQMKLTQLQGADARKERLANLITKARGGDDVAFGQAVAEDSALGSTLTKESKATVDPKDVALAAQGDIGAIGRIGAVNPSYLTLLKEQNPTMGSEAWKKAKEFEASLIPREDKTIVQIADPNNPDGPGIYVNRAAAIGQNAPAKPRAENAQNAIKSAMGGAAVGEMGVAHNNMVRYENDLKSGKISIGGLQQFLGAVGNSFTHDDAASRLIQTQALNQLNKSNPDLARYIRSGLSFAEGESMLSQRPSDFRTKMAAFLSTAASGAPSDMVDDIQRRRSSILTPAQAALGPKTAPPAGGRGGGNPAPKGKTMTQAEYNALPPALQKAATAGGYQVVP